MKPLAISSAQRAGPPASAGAGLPAAGLAKQLRPGDVDVWRAALDDAPAGMVRTLQALLSSDERERARRFFFERDRRRFVVARGTLRRLLAGYLDCAPAEIAFSYGPNGKPALPPATPGAAPLHFNVAHSDGLALYAFTRVGEIGVDVERIRDIPDWESIAELSFSRHELARLRACPPPQRREEFFRAWTRQEAVLKALGTGLAGCTPGAATDTGAFCVHPLNVAPGFAAAIVASAPAIRLVRTRPEPAPANGRDPTNAFTAPAVFTLKLHASSGPDFL
jgi:phosphopantetheine--protein transferase-like protein